MILHIPSGIFIRFNALAASCAASCAMMRITIAATEPPITFWYSFSIFLLSLLFHIPTESNIGNDKIHQINSEKQCRRNQKISCRCRLNPRIKIKLATGIYTDQSTDCKRHTRRTEIITDKLLENHPADFSSAVTNLRENPITEFVFYGVAELLHRKYCQCHA